MSAVVAIPERLSAGVGRVSDSREAGLGAVARICDPTNIRLGSAERRARWMGTRAMSVLERIAAGDSGAVRECIDRYGGLVWSLARRMCPSRAEAEDAVQEVFISLWRSSGRYSPELGSESTFIAMIARRRLIDRVRRNQRRLDSTAIDPEISESVVASPATGRENAAGLEQDEAARAAEAVLTELSEDQQRVLRLSIMQGLSHEKISSSTGMPLGTVKTHIRRGLIRARKLISERRNGVAGTAANGSAGGAVSGSGHDTGVAT